MKVRGDRECKDCGTRWSYYETGGVECPSCGSMRSVGVGDRKRHTDAAGTLDLDEARAVAADEPLRRAASVAEDACRDYVTKRGFISGGDLLDLDDVYVAAQELKYAAGELATRMDVDEDVEEYVLALLQGAETGDRPAPEMVPTGIRSARGLAIGSAVHVYRMELRTFVEDDDTDTPEDAPRFLERLAQHEKRIDALDGDVDPNHAAAMLDAARAVGQYISTGSEEARADADDILAALSS